MSGATVPSPPEPPAALQAAELTALRAEIDRADDALHAALMRRAEVVAAVAGLNTKRATALRPGREAAIIRRLLAGHEGPLPRHAIVRLWRELLAATTAMQGRFTLAVCETDPERVTVAAAREHFGALTPLCRFATPAQALGAVRQGAAAVAVLPLPTAAEPERAAWWPTLLRQQGPRLWVVARLPFWAPRPEGAPAAQAFAVSAAQPDPSGEDRSLLGLELAGSTGPARLGMALAAAGFAVHEVMLRQSGAAAIALADIEGFVAEDDPRWSAVGDVVRPPVVLGAYAVPIEESRR